MKKQSVELSLTKENQSLLLSIKGSMPAWLSGTLVRNGPVSFSIDQKKVDHWFDGLAMLHAFSFSQGKVNYSNRYLRSNAYSEVTEKAKIKYLTFATDPCGWFFKHHFSLLLPFSSKTIQNANVNVDQLGQDYVALTEVPLPVRFDIKTLETLGVYEFDDALPTRGCFESAHPHYDRQQNQRINYLVDFGRKCHYEVYSINKKSKKRVTLAKIPISKPAYMHSFSITEKYVIFSEYPLRVSPLDLLIKGKPFIQNYVWDGNEPTKWLVIDRKKGSVYKRFETEAMFSFHHVNAYEQNGKLIVDLIAYPDAQIIQEVKNYDSPMQQNPFLNDVPISLRRFELNLKTGKAEDNILFQYPMELPRFNEKQCEGRKYRYVYASDPRPVHSHIDRRGLIKYDLEWNQTTLWEQEGCLPGEPVFVPFPEGTLEDEGVVLSIVLDVKNQSSFLLVLEGRSFSELARAEVPFEMPVGLHGQFFE